MADCENCSFIAGRFLLVLSLIFNGFLLLTDKDLQQTFLMKTEMLKLYLPESLSFLITNSILLVKVLGLINIFSVVLLYTQQKLIFFLNVVSIVLSTMILYDPMEGKEYDPAVCYRLMKNLALIGGLFYVVGETKVKK